MGEGRGAAQGECQGFQASLNNDAMSEDGIDQSDRFPLYAVAGYELSCSCLP